MTWTATRRPGVHTGVLVGRTIYFDPDRERTYILREHHAQVKNEDGTIKMRPVTTPSGEAVKDENGNPSLLPAVGDPEPGAPVWRWKMLRHMQWLDIWPRLAPPSGPGDLVLPSDAILRTRIPALLDLLALCVVGVDGLVDDAGEVVTYPTERDARLAWLDGLSLDTITELAGHIMAGHRLSEAARGN